MSQKSSFTKPEFHVNLFPLENNEKYSLGPVGIRSEQEEHGNSNDNIRGSRLETESIAHPEKPYAFKRLTQITRLHRRNFS